MQLMVFLMFASKTKLGYDSTVWRAPDETAYVSGSRQTSDSKECAWHHISWEAHAHVDHQDKNQRRRHR